MNYLPVKIFILFLSFTYLPCFGQNNGPVKWTFELNKISDQEYEFAATANIQKSWVIYSQNSDENGPIATLFVINEIPYKLEEKSKSIKEFDPMFDVTVIKFKDKALFTKKIKVTETREFKGYVTYMTCDGSRCLPPVDVVFDLKIN